jgi:hypothetical protein
MHALSKIICQLGSETFCFVLNAFCVFLINKKKVTFSLFFTVLLVLNNKYTTTYRFFINKKRPGVAL